MDFFVDEPVEPPRPKVGDLLTVIVNGQKRHAIVTAVRDEPDGACTADMRLDPTEPPMTFG